MSDFKAKMHKIPLSPRLRPRPRWGSLQRSPRTPSCISWTYFSGEGGGDGKKRGNEERGGGKGQASKYLEPLVHLMNRCHISRSWQRRQVGTASIVDTVGLHYRHQSTCPLNIARLFSATDDLPQWRRQDLARGTERHRNNASHARKRVARVTAGLAESNGSLRTAGFMTHVTCRLTATNRDQLRNATLGIRVWATFTFLQA